MITLTRSERLALLLTLLGEEAKGISRSILTGESLDEVEEALADFAKYPATDDEIDLVLQDFQAYFRLAAQSAASEVEAEGEEASSDDDSDAQSHDGPRLLQLPEEQFEVELEPSRRFETQKPTGNTQHDLNRLHPYQVATALKSESPLVIAMVVSQLANEHAAKTLEFLPQETRNLAVLALAKPIPTKQVIVEKVLDTTLKRASLVEERQHDQESSDKLANLIRSLPKNLRGSILEELLEKDAALAESVKKKLYKFEDICRLSDRDMQKFLGNCRTETLTVALQQAEPELLTKVLGNMSKRAKQTLQEEMEFATNSKQEEIDAERDTLVTTLAEMDESGAIEVV